jgi:hypothetical protein
MAIVWLEELGQLKNPMTSSGIEPVTCRLVLWCLKHVSKDVPSVNGCIGHRTKGSLLTVACLTASMERMSLFG